MNTHISASQIADSFDIQTGMAVYAVDGERIGTVMDIAGFGSTKIPTQASPEDSIRQRAVLMAE